MFLPGIPPGMMTFPVGIYGIYMEYMEYTWSIWIYPLVIEFNIAIEHCPFIDVF